MSQLGTSGKPILALANFFLSAEHDNGDRVYALHFKFTEPYANGGPYDGEMTGSTSFTTDIQPTDSEIIAQNKDTCAAYIADRYQDPSFTAGDIRGGDFL